MHQAADNQKCGNTLGNHGCQRDTRYVHLKLGNKEYVQCCIDNGADIIISGAGLPMELPQLIGDAQDRTSEVIHHRCRHTGKINPHVDRRFIDDIVRCPHQFQPET